MKNTTIKISATAKNFFNYSFKGDGKYYLTSQGSRHYNQTDFSKFLNANSDCIEVVERGNDAPRGGRTGDFVIVKFNEKFNEKFDSFFVEKANIRQAEILKYENEKIERLESEAKAKIIFTEYLTADKKEALKIELQNRNSKKGKNFLKMKSINKTGDYRNYYLLEQMIYA